MSESANPTTGPTVVIRRAADADAEAMQEIFNQEVVGSTASWEWFPLSNDDWRAWFHEHTKEHHVLLVAEVDHAVAGFAGYGEFRAKQGYVSTVEDSVFLREGYRGMGLGTRLLSALMDQARARSVHAMVAAVTSENEASIRLHEACGFRQVGYLPQVGHKFGRWLDLVLLQATLDEDPIPGRCARSVD
ncbi:MAG: N-acetyltransferase family protein [Propionibacteriaceae bacterium]|nr:N-acetyltransferase family protein [Propionibacteriaceae bacterium]